MWAAEEGRLDIAQMVLDAGASLDAVNNAGQTAVMWAAYELQPGTAR